MRSRDGRADGDGVRCKTQLLFVLRGCRLWVTGFPCHTIDLRGRNVQRGEQGFVGQGIVAPRIIRWDAAFIAEEKGGPGPIEAIGEGGRGQRSVEGFRRRAA